MVARCDHRTDQRESRLAATARFFLARPNRWIDAHEIARVGGTLAWRSRVSELRRSPYRLDIRNRTVPILHADGTRVLASEYRLNVAETAR